MARNRPCLACELRIAKGSWAGIASRISKYLRMWQEGRVPIVGGGGGQVGQEIETIPSRIEQKTDVTGFSC